MRKRRIAAAVGTVATTGAAVLAFAGPAAVAGAVDAPRPASAAASLSLAEAWKKSPYYVVHWMCEMYRQVAEEDGWSTAGCYLDDVGWFFVYGH